MNRALVLGVYKRCLRTASALNSPELEALARSRYVEFLPKLFTLPTDTEGIPSIIRRAFRFPHAASSDPTSPEAALHSIQAVTNAFNFMRHVEQEKGELDVVAQWIKHDPKRCPEVVGASIIAQCYSNQLVTRGNEPIQDRQVTSSTSNQQLTSLDKTINDVTVQVDAIALLVRALLLKKNSSQPQQPLKKKKRSKASPPTKKQVAQTASPDELIRSMDARVVVQTIIDVLLRDMKFTAVIVSPVEGFLIDKVLSSRLGSASILSLLFSAVGKRLGLKCSVTLDQRCPMVKVACPGPSLSIVEVKAPLKGKPLPKKQSSKRKTDDRTDDEKSLFVNLVDGGSILSPSDALEYHVKNLNNNEQAKLSLKAADLRVVYCGILASILVATNAPDDAKLRLLLKAQLIHLAKS